MKKLLFVFASVLMLLLVTPINAEGDEIVNMNVSIDKQNDCYVVSFPDSDLFASAKPTMEVLIDYTNAEVHKGSKTGNVVASTLTNGKISFVVDEGGTYYILPKADEAFAILTDNGDLIFFRNNGTYTNGNTYTVSINDTSYTGRVFTDVENVQTKDAPWKDYKSSIKKAYTASGFAITPLDMCNWFANCTNLTSFDFKGFNLSGCTDIGDLFVLCGKLTTITNFDNIDTGNVTVFENLFNGCTSLPAQTIVDFATKLNTDKATVLTGMFAGTNVATLNLSNFNTANVTDFSYMFNGCSNLTTLDLSSFDTSKATSGSEKMENMFKDCNKLEKIVLGADFKKNTNDNLCLRTGNWRYGETQTIVTQTALFESSNIAGEWNYVKYVYVSFDTGTEQTITAKRIMVNDGYGNLPCPGCSMDLSVKEGYEFDGWYDAKTGGNKVESTTKVTKDTDHILYAHWNESTYNVYCVADEGQSPTLAGTRKYSESFTLPASAAYTKTGYSFNGWTLNGNVVTAINSFTLGDVTVNGKWKANSYEVTFDSQGGDAANKITVTYDSTYGQLPSITKKGYKFLGWFTEATDGTQIKSDTKVAITAAQTLYAHWQLNALTVKLIEDGAIVEKNDFPKGYSLAEYYDNYQDPVKSGYIFKEWNTKVDGTGTAYSKDSSINEDITLYAIFVKIEIENPEIGTYADENKQAVADVSKKTQAAEAVLAAETSKVIIPDEVSSKVDDQDVLSELGTTKENVEMVIETHLKMDITSVTTDKDENINKFIIDITPLYTVKAKVKGVARPFL